MVGEIQLAFGGVAAKTITAPKTEALLAGKPWTEANLTAALLTLSEDVWISPTAPGTLKACIPCLPRACRLAAEVLSDPT